LEVEPGNITMQSKLKGQTIFLKLGGSLITDKTQVEVVRDDILPRVAKEMRRGRQSNPDLKLLLGHGSGSFGHVPAAKYRTRDGVQSDPEWQGFVEVGRVASKLNAIVRNHLSAEGLKILSLQPSASAWCQDGKLIQMSLDPVIFALNVGLIPLIYGDISFDTVRGGTIISTEEIMSFLADKLKPSWLFLAGETEGVLDNRGRVIPIISAQNYESIRPMLGGSRGTDVTGGMASKIASMLDLVERHIYLQIRVFSGLIPGEIEKVLSGDSTVGGTVIRWSAD
jgi:isopentenyl phosphate kinase